jgi:hypothetical protein
MSTTLSEYSHTSVSGWTKRSNLTSLVTELKRQAASKVDFVSDVRSLSILPPHDPGADPRPLLASRDAQTAEFIPSAGIPLQRNAFIQLAARCDPSVPVRYIEALFDKNPDEAIRHLNTVMRDTGGRRLVRCLDDSVRAFLSNRYRVLDHLDVAFTSLQVAEQYGALPIECCLSDTSMRLKLIVKDLWEEIDLRRQTDPNWFVGGLGNQDHLSRVAARSIGDLPGGPNAIYPMATVSNSETGHGGYNVRIGILQGICFNLATVEDVVTRVHLGETLEEGMFSAETHQLEARTIIAKATDALRTCFTQDAFRRLVSRIRSAASDLIEAPTPAVSNLITRTDLTESDRDRILEYFLRDYDASRYGLASAVSRYAQDIPDPDRSSSIEAIAGTLLLQPSLCAVTT